MKRVPSETLAVWFGSAAVLLAVAGCATRGSVQELQAQIAQVKEQVEELRQAQETTTRELAKTVSDLKGLDGQMTTLAEAEKGAAQKVDRLEARLGETDEAVRGIRGSLDALSQGVLRRATGPTSAVKAAEPERPQRAGPAEQLYAAALANFRAHQQGQAVLEFTDFIARFPQHPLVANAQFWIGQAYYEQRDYAQALKEYQKVLDLNSQGGKASDALFQIGLCFRALNDPTRAREAWRQLVEAYPDTEAARQARSLIRAPVVPVRRAR